MGRPPLPLGTPGKVQFVHLSSGHTQARVLFRDFDGRVRLVSKNARTRAAAERALKVALAERQAPPGTGAITSSTLLSELAALWLEAPHGWSTGTERTYKSVIRNQVVPALGALRAREVTPGVVSRALRAIAERHGPSAAKSAKACLSGMFGLAIEDGAIAANPVRDASARISVTKKSPRALTREEVTTLTGWLRANERALAADIPDLVDWMLATGCRIGEALALRHGSNGDGRPLLDLDAKTWEVNATVVRVPKQGLLVQPRPKTAAGWRVIAVPDFAVGMIRARPAPGPGGLVFTGPEASTPRDPSNASGDLRQLLDSFDCDACQCTGFTLATDGSFALGMRGQRVRCDAGPWSWVTSHVFRKTVATRLDEAGLSPRQVADQLGHANPSMTLDVYFGRQVVSAEAAKALDR
ncbi:MAG TPA: tyrosine-type recombinase/integrase [Jatrophihabitans sp.]|uniref:tyrosine-type recombinase/integrase n=1 Tax=Jatrophihabitans sp. TaxID=1932789 RepID=UPI002E006066|nr:tyrosine-type recombinase/integrase [Jatrophihabitans sp.]